MRWEFGKCRALSFEFGGLIFIGVWLVYGLGFQALLVLALAGFAWSLAGNAWLSGF